MKINITKSGQALYGDNWRAPLARALDVNERTIRRWENEEFEVNPSIAPELIKLFDQKIRELNEAKKEMIMKVGVCFEEFNAGDYCGHSIQKAETKPEYHVVLQIGDRLLDDGTLVRQGLHYTQVTKMSSFRGVAFVNLDDFDEPDTITCKLIKA